MNVEKFTQKGIEKIKSSSILSNDDYSTMSEMSVSLQHVFEKRQIFRTETEIKYSVLDELRCPTDAGKYWQIIREEFNMFENLMNLSFQYEDLNCDLQLKEIELTEIDDSVKGKIYQMKKRNEIKRLQFVSSGMILQAKDIVRELKIWESLKTKLKSRSEFDLDDCNANQFETLKLKWENQLKISKESGNETMYKNSKIGLEAIEKDFMKID